MTSVVGTAPRVAPVRVNLTDIPAGGDGFAGVNKPMRATTEDGQDVVFKHNDVSGYGAFGRLIPPSVKRMLDVKEIVLSHISHDDFKLPGATYREAYVLDAQGHRQEGIISDWMPGIETLHDAPVTDIKDGDLAVREAVVKGFLGDADTTKPLSSNVWIVKPTGQPIVGDFGNAGQRGVSVLGVPRANQQVMWKFANDHNVEPAVEEIRNLSDEQIKAMVDRAGSKYVHDWSPRYSRKISTVLIHNRNQLERHDVFARYYQGWHPLLAPTMSNVIAPALKQAWHVQQALGLLKETAAAKLGQLLGKGQA